MPKLNQRGALDPLLIVLLVIVIALGGYVTWTLFGGEDEMSSQIETTQNSAPNENIEEEVQVSYQEYPSIGLKHELPAGWTHTTEETNNPSPKVTHTVSHPESDLQIEITNSSFRGGFGSCGAGASYSANPNEYVENSIFHHQRLSHEGYVLVGMEEVSVPNNVGSVGDRLMILDANENNWYSSIPQTKTGYESDRIEAVDLEASNNYFYCIVEPRPGFTLDTPVKYNAGEEWAGLTSVEVVSSSDSLVSMVNNPEQFTQVLDILDSLTPIN